MIDFFTRLDNFMKTNNLNDNRVTVEAGLSNGIIGKARQRRSMSQENISKLLHAYPLNANWLFNGIGEMMLEETGKLREPSLVYRLKTDVILDNQKIPLYSAEAIAGVVPVFDDLVKQEPIDYLYVPNAPKCDGAIIASGDSMYPLINSGDYLGYKIIEDIINDIYPDQMYILHLTVADEAFRTIKFVHKGKSEKHLKLVSENKQHQDKEILISKIISIAQVKLLVRRY